MILTFMRWLDAQPLTSAESWFITIGVMITTMGATVAILWLIGLLMEAFQAWLEQRHVAAFVAEMKREAAEEAQRRRQHLHAIVSESDKRAL